MLNALNMPALEALPPRSRTQARPAARAPSCLQVVDTVAGLDALAPEWNDLFARAGRPINVFQTHAFAALWARTYLARDGETDTDTRLAIVTARVAGRLVLVWPLVIEHQLGLRVLSWLGAPIAQYGDILLDPSRDGAAIVDAAWDSIRTELRPDVVRLRKVRADAAIAPHLARIGAVETCRDEAASVTLAGRDGQSFETGLSGRARKNRRRLMRRLREQGTVEFERLSGSAAAQALVEAGLAIKRRWLGARGQYSQAFADPRLDRFFGAAAAADATAGAGLTVYGLELDGRPISVVLGFACQDRMTLHVIGYDLDVERSGAGVLALEAVLRDCESRGFTAVDLLAPKAAYKMDWADATIDVVDHAVPVSLKGRACVTLYDGFIRGQAKATLEHLPLALRQLIAATV